MAKRRLHGLSGTTAFHANRGKYDLDVAARFFEQAATAVSKGLCGRALSDYASGVENLGRAKAHSDETLIATSTTMKREFDTQHVSLTGGNVFTKIQNICLLDTKFDGLRKPARKRSRKKGKR